MSWGTRIKAFITCFIIGILLTILGSFALFLGGLSLFAIFYTLGNVVSMVSTCFLVGPVNQVKKMFSPTRAIATILVIVSFCLTLVSAILVSMINIKCFLLLKQLYMQNYYCMNKILFRSIGYDKQNRYVQLDEVKCQLLLQNPCRHYSRSF